MKREHRLRYIIKEGILDTFYIWKDELKNVFKDAGVLIFFFVVPFAYPLLYSFIYNNEVIREAKMVVVDQSDSYLSREFTRRVNATPDVKVVAVLAVLQGVPAGGDGSVVRPGKRNTDAQCSGRIGEAGGNNGQSDPL